MFNGVSLKSKEEEIRQLRFFEYVFYENEGGATNFRNEEFEILSFPEIFKKMSERILKLGFTEIERVEPAKANCIIRIYTKEHYKYEQDLIYNLYGSLCFTFKKGKWSTIGSSGDYEIDNSKCIMRHWIFQDEYIDFDCDFVDYYVRIK